MPVRSSITYSMTNYFLSCIKSNFKNSSVLVCVYHQSMQVKRGESVLNHFMSVMEFVQVAFCPLHGSGCSGKRHFSSSLKSVAFSVTLKAKWKENMSSDVRKGGALQSECSKISETSLMIRVQICHLDDENVKGCGLPGTEFIIKVKDNLMSADEFHSFSGTTSDWWLTSALPETSAAVKWGTLQDN